MPWEPPLLSPGGARGGPIVKHPFQRAKQRLEEEGETQKLVAEVSGKTRRGRGVDQRLPQHASCRTRGSLKSEADSWGHVGHRAGLRSSLVLWLSTRSVVLRAQAGSLLHPLMEREREK